MTNRSSQTWNAKRSFNEAEYVTGRLAVHGSGDQLVPDPTGLHGGSRHVSCSVLPPSGSRVQCLMSLSDHSLPISDVDTDSKVQLFLEKAEEFILENRLLTPELWRKLAVLAAELELPAPLFRSTLEDLVERGVLDRSDQLPPLPPPLPAGSENKRPDLVQEVGFALSAPPECENLDPGRISSSSLASLPPPRPVAGTTGGSTLNDSGPARESTTRVRAAQTRPETAETMGGPPEKAGRWRVEGSPAPAPLLPTKKPAETYVDFLRQSLSYVSDQVVSLDLEQRLFCHGTRVLTLSPVYARQLLEKAAAERSLTFASATAKPAELAESDPSLAQTPAAEPKTGDSSLPKLSTPLPPDPDQQARLGPFQDYVRTSLERIPPGMLPIPLLERLCNAGTDLYGLESNLVSEAIKHLARERRIDVMTQAEAEAKLSELVADTIGETLTLSQEQREYVRLAGTKLGLPLPRIDAVAEDAARAYRAAYRREQTMTRLALIAAIFALLFVLCFIGYVFLAAVGRASE